MNQQVKQLTEKHILLVRFITATNQLCQQIHQDKIPKEDMEIMEKQLLQRLDSGKQNFLIRQQFGDEFYNDYMKCIINQNDIGVNFFFNPLMGNSNSNTRQLHPQITTNYVDVQEDKQKLERELDILLDEALGKIIHIQLIIDDKIVLDEQILNKIKSLRTDRLKPIKLQIREKFSSVELKLYLNIILKLNKDAKEINLYFNGKEIKYNLVDRLSQYGIHNGSIIELREKNE